MKGPALRLQALPGPVLACYVDGTLTLRTGSPFAGDFASAFADLSALGPVASLPSLGLDPNAGFDLAASGACIAIH
jgi:hypothetical protein